MERNERGGFGVSKCRSVMDSLARQCGPPFLVSPNDNNAIQLPYTNGNGWKGAGMMRHLLGDSEGAPPLASAACEPVVAPRRQGGR